MISGVVYLLFFTQSMSRQSNYLQSYSDKILTNISLSIDKQTNDIVSALETGQGKSRVTIGLDLSVDVTSHVQ